MGEEALGVTPLVWGVQELIGAEDMRLLYLRPCPADFDPTQLAWSKLKRCGGFFKYCGHAS